MVGTAFLQFFGLTEHFTRVVKSVKIDTCNFDWLVMVGYFCMARVTSGSNKANKLKCLLVPIILLALRNSEVSRRSKVQLTFGQLKKKRTE
jgi:hypothetical protein